VAVGGGGSGSEFGGGRLRAEANNVGRRGCCGLEGVGGGRQGIISNFFVSAGIFASGTGQGSDCYEFRRS
jgi:hypothetical protein